MRGRAYGGLRPYCGRNGSFTSCDKNPGGRLLRPSPNPSLEGRGVARDEAVFVPGIALRTAVARRPRHELADVTARIVEVQVIAGVQPADLPLTAQRVVKGARPAAGLGLMDGQQPADAAGTL